MKFVKILTNDGKYHETLLHDLDVIGNGATGKPIDLWAMLMAKIQPDESEHKSIRKWQCGYMIQLKREAVAHFHKVFTDAAGQVGPPDQEQYVRPYSLASRLLASLDAYLGSIYAVLEAVAEYNHAVDNNLSDSFRKQIPRIAAFSMDENDWLGAFYDLRSELTHHSSPILSISGNDVLVTFSRAKRNLHFPQDGETLSVSMEDLIALWWRLEELLDRWARSELGRLDPSVRIEIFVTDREGVPRGELLELAFLLDLVGY